MSAMVWCPLYAECADDPKFRLIAKISAQPLIAVKGLWAHLLCRATSSPEPGRLVGWNNDVEACALDVEPGVLAKMVDAMQGILLADDRLIGWVKRQLVRKEKPLTAGARRQRAYAEKKKSAAREPELDLTGGGVTEASASVIPGVIPAAYLEGDEERKSSPPSGASRAREPCGRSVINFPEKRSHVDGRRTRIPEDWWPDQAGCQFAQSRGHDERWISEQTELFRDHHLARGEPRADWNASWRTWVQRAGDFVYRGTAGGAAARVARSGPSVAASVARANAYFAMGGR